MYTLNVLIIEDSESDAALIIRKLKKAGYTIHHERVETAEEMKAALAMIAWDIIIADYKLPQFNAPAALTLLKKSDLDIPFIVVSGTIGEETAVELMKAGAHDYLMKDKLIRLVPTVKREIAEAQVRRERQQMIKALRASEERYRTLSEAAHDMIFIVSRDDLVEYVNTSAAGLFHQRPEEIIGKTRASLFPPEASRGQQRFLQNVFETGMPKYVESKTELIDQVTWLGTWLVPLLDDIGQVTGVMGVARDITNQKWLEEDKQKLLNKLQKALTQIKTLSGLLPICSVCKKIRDDKGYWKQVEDYIQNHTDVTFTHGVCPDCFPKLYPDFDSTKPEETEEQR
ncbi:MAG: PAS domain-containing protein [Bacteroidota bacterium]|jgi:PAS domain S-box-containing protein